MESQKKNYRVCFEKNLDALLLSAAAEVSPIIESLELNNLEENMRRGRVYLGIRKYVDQLLALNRFDYVFYYKDAGHLFKVFESMDRLNCPEEMEKLRKAITWKEIVDCLLMIKLEMDIRQQAADFFASKEPQLPADIFLAGGTVNVPPVNDKSVMINGFSQEAKITFITLLLNQRLGLLVHHSSLKQFVQWILHPNTLENEPPIYIGCKTNEFKCIMEHFKYFNNAITDAEIGRHGVFISHKGTVIKAGLLASSNCDNLNTRHAIANIFAMFK